MYEQVSEESGMQRGRKEGVAQSREAEVDRLCRAVKSDLKFWEYAFKRMKDWRSFARGRQWPDMTKEELSDADRPYVVNITQRHIQQRTAHIYAKNPRFRFKKAKRLNYRLWDGTANGLMAAQMQMQQDPSNMVAMQIIQEAMANQQTSQMLDGAGKTLTYLYEHQVREQNPPTKKMMKKMVRTTLTCGVGYIKQTFQRAMDLSPDGHQAINDASTRLAEVERLGMDLQDGEIGEHDAEIEQLRALIADLEKQHEIVVREGLALDYPDSTNIIPDQNLSYLPGFVGCSRVTEQYCLTADQVKRIYKVDVSKSAVEYTDREDLAGPQSQPELVERKTVRVWEIWNIETGMVCVVCDGYNDYLVEPHAPITYTDRFWPWFVFAPNAMDDSEDPFPPSDVELIQSQQAELNRAGEGLRQHRWANRPRWVTGQNLPETDRAKMESASAHSISVLHSMPPEAKVNDKIQPFPAMPIDPSLYNSGPAFQDILRAAGTQEANLGGTSGATATESSIAHASQKSVESSATDEFDDLLTEMARAGGQILLAEMSPDQVMQIVGPGAIWPQMSREQIAKEVELAVVAGSSGLQNQAHEVQVRERVYPLLFQIPGLSPEWLARDLLQTLDDRMDYEDAIDMNALSIIAANGQLQGEANRGGADNAPRPGMPQQQGQMGPTSEGDAQPTLFR
jgi:hypothetical protein